MVENPDQPKSFWRATGGEDGDFSRLENVLRILSDAETAEALRTTIHKGTYFDLRGACLHPCRYMRGLAAGLAARGARIYTAGSVISLARTEHDWVRAKSVIIATNAYSQPLMASDDLHRRVIARASSFATRMFNSTESKTALPWRLPITETPRLVSYFRILPTGELLFGGRADITGRRDRPCCVPHARKAVRDEVSASRGNRNQGTLGRYGCGHARFPSPYRSSRGWRLLRLRLWRQRVVLTSLIGRHPVALIAGERAPMGPDGRRGFQARAVLSVTSQGHARNDPLLPISRSLRTTGT
nr:FAD-dependent oxidoreductase [Nitrosomonas nitrosa]